MKNNRKIFTLLLCIIVSTLIATGCAGKGSRDKSTVKLGETYSTASLGYTVTEDISTGHLILSITDGDKFDGTVMVSAVIYPDNNLYPIQTKSIVFDGNGESETFLLPYTTDSLPLYIDFQENYNQYSEGNDVINGYSLNWGFKVAK